MIKTNMLRALTDNIVVDKTRCVACGICVERCPMDNLRLNLSPCRQGCPLGVNAQGYVQLAARGEDERALALVREALPFPGILGRICSQPCESKCHHNEVRSSPVAIRAIKRSLADRFAHVKPSPPECASDTGKRIAVIGAGPAGLMAAYELRLRGHGVVVFDTNSSPGGMLRTAIPEFRLPLGVLERELSLLDDIGVRFFLGHAVGRDVSSDEIIKEYDAVLLATGCPGSKRLGIEGEDLEGVRHALGFLRGIREGRRDNPGARVAVIGGGNAAVDAAQSALRLGAREVRMICLEGEGGMPAFPHALKEAREECIGILNSWGPVRFIGEGERIKAIEFHRCKSLYDEKGRFRPLLDSCEAMRLEVDCAIIAAGQEADDSLLRAFGVSGDAGYFDPLTMETSRNNIFLAGDCAGGPSTVVEAMASGRRAAESIHRFVCGEDMRFGRAYRGPVETEFEIDAGGSIDTVRADVPRRSCTDALDFGEIEGALSADAARREAARCFSCGRPYGKYGICWFCLACEIECPHEALRVEIPYLLR